MDRLMRIAQLEEQLRKNREQFALYARNHRAKDGGHTPGSDTFVKAATNERMVQEIDAILHPEPVLESELNKDFRDARRPTHAQMVAVLQKPGVDILAALTPHKADMLHMALGIASEGGEVADAIKAWAIYGKELDRDNVVEELGDLEFFMEGLRRELKITRDETLEANIDKLGKRYADFAYSDAAAIERADKA